MSLINRLRWKYTIWRWNRPKLSDISAWFQEKAQRLTGVKLMYWQIRTFGDSRYGFRQTYELIISKGFSNWIYTGILKTWRFDLRTGYSTTIYEFEGKTFDAPHKALEAYEDATR